MKPGTLMKCAIALSLCGAAGAETPAERRAAFLKLIDRPRAPLAASAEESIGSEALAQVKFSFNAEEGQRVPGVLLRSTVVGRRPAVIVLHGAGGNKEAQLPLLRQLATKGFLTVAIDGR